MLTTVTAAGTALTLEELINACGPGADQYRLWATDPGAPGDVPDEGRVTAVTVYSGSGQIHVEVSGFSGLNRVINDVGEVLTRLRAMTDKTGAVPKTELRNLIDELEEAIG